MRRGRSPPQVRALRAGCPSPSRSVEAVAAVAVLWRVLGDQLVDAVGDDDDLTVGSASLAVFYDEADRGAPLAVDLAVGEGGHAHEVEPAGGDVATCDGHGLDRLVERAGAPDLGPDTPPLPETAAPDPQTGRSPGGE